MNNIWSEKIQGIKTLYFSRKLRFDDFFASRYKELFKIDQKPGVRIIEIGCGPGALAGALHRWYPEAAITAIPADVAIPDGVNAIYFTYTGPGSAALKSFTLA